MSTPLENNTSALQALKLKAEALPDSSPDTYHITKITCHSRETITKAPSTSGYNFKVYLNDAEVANIVFYGDDGVNDYDVDFEYNIKTDYLSVVPYQGAIICMFKLYDDNTLEIRGINGSFEDLYRRCNTFNSGER